MENDYFDAAFQIIVAFLWAMTIKLLACFLAWVPPLWLEHLVLEVLSKEISCQVKRVDGNSDVSSRCMYFVLSLPAFPDGTGPFVPVTLCDCKITAKDSSENERNKGIILQNCHYDGSLTQDE